MDAHPARHPTDDTLRSYGLGELDDRSARAVDRHLEQCPDCRQRSHAMSADSVGEGNRDAQKSAGDSASVPPRRGPIGTEKGRNVPTPPPPGTLPPGLAELRDYEIKRELGRGGMGVVYLAHNTLMDRDEVLKVMGRQIVDRPGLVERFLREIRAVARLRHPNIVTAYRATRLGESIVFAMEYVKGYDLAQLVKGQGPLSVSLACNFVYQAALGLQHAHEEGLVHRDIKPDNLMLARDGDKATVKILDFGLAKATREEKVERALTSTGQTLGTPDFIAPEQILDAPRADIRADIYSLGGTLYYLLTGRPPFQASSLYDIYQAHISRDATPLNLVRPDVPPELAALVATMLAKDPARRFQTPRDVSQALKPFFKAAGASFGASNADVSHLDQAVAGRREMEVSPVPTGPATGTGGAIVPSQAEAERAIPKAGSESMFEFKKIERPPDAVKPKPVPAAAPLPRPPWATWPAIAATSLIVGVVLSVMVYTTTHKARTKIAADEKVSETRLEHKTRDGGSSRAKTSGPASPSQGATGDLSAPSPGFPAAAGTGGALLTNTIGMKLILIPADEFLMGSPDMNHDADSDEKPRHWVRIGRPFYLGIHEVTRGQFRRFVDETGFRTEAENDGKGGFGYDRHEKKSKQAPRFTWLNPGFEQTDEHPVLNVSWNDAVAFAAWLSQKEGRTYRLPTEAEWEYACRAGTTTRYQTGDDPEGLAAVGNVADGTAKPMIPAVRTIAANDGSVFTAPVGRYQPNKFGLYDMHGNVWEHCSDWFGGDYFQRSASVDPQGPPTGHSRVLRGGGWGCNPNNCRSAHRERAAPDDLDSVGFRLVMEQPGH